MFSHACNLIRGRSTLILFVISIRAISNHFTSVIAEQKTLRKRKLYLSNLTAFYDQINKLLQIESFRLMYTLSMKFCSLDHEFLF